MDMTQFSHWLAEQQEKSVKSLWQEKRQAPESLVKDLCQTLQGTHPTAVGAKSFPGQPYSCLSKVTPDDDIEAYPLFL